jgi:hypothetical protein
VPATLDDADEALKQSFRGVFGDVVEGLPPL